MLLSRRQRNISTPNGGQQYAFDPEYPTPDRDDVKLTTLPISAHQRSWSKGVLLSVIPLNLRRAWQSFSQAPAGHAGKSIGSSASGQGHAPASAESVCALERRQAGRGGWVRILLVALKYVLVIIGGKIIYDVLLLNWTSMGGKLGPNGKGGVSDKQKKDPRNSRSADVVDSKKTRHLSPKFPETFHLNNVANSFKDAADSLPSIWNQGTDIKNELVFGNSVTERKAQPPLREKSDGGEVSDEGERYHQTKKYREPLLSLATTTIDTRDVASGRARSSVQAPRVPLELNAYDGQRVAVVVPYIGDDLPVWWDVFADHARRNHGLVDWVIFCDKKIAKEDSPSNIKFFPMTTRRMAWLLTGVVEPEIDGLNDGSEPFLKHVWDGKGTTKSKTATNGVPATAEESHLPSYSHSQIMLKKALASNLDKRKRAASFLYQLLIVSPYFLVEFKPALGWLFREYLGEYTHWAYGDLDVLFGDMRRGWLEPNELQTFDIITFSFGDQYRAYLRGQLTIHKNEFRVNRIWRGCSHLVNYSDRLEAFRLNRSLPLESAEGCYSVAAASDPSLKIKFAVKALSDVDNEGSGEVPWQDREVIIDGDGLVTLCPDLGYYEGPNGASGNNAATLSGGGGSSYQTMQDAVGSLIPVSRADPSQGKCEHWIKLEHQTCVENVGGGQTLFLMGGEYFKQEFINTAAATGGRDCRAGAFYHFQVLFKNVSVTFGHAQHQFKESALCFVVTQSGVVRGNISKHKFNYRTWNSQPPVSSVHFGVAAGPGGIVPLPAPGWRKSVLGPGLQPPPEHARKTRHYCLAWATVRRLSSSKEEPSEQVCATKVSSAEIAVIVDTRATLQTLSDEPPPSKLRTVTLGGVGHADGLAPFLSNAGEWRGPKIFGMVVDFDKLEVTRKLPIFTRVKYIRGGVFVVALVRPPPNPELGRVVSAFPQKALMNLVSDLCESRYLLTLPELSHLSPNAFQGVYGDLFRRSSFPKEKKAGETSLPSKVPGPVTLVIPVEGSTPPAAPKIADRIAALPPYSVSTAAVEIAEASRKAAALALGRTRETLAASKIAEEMAAAAAEAAAEIVEAIRGAVAGKTAPLSDSASSASAMTDGSDGAVVPDSAEWGVGVEPLRISFGTALSGGVMDTSSSKHTADDSAPSPQVDTGENDMMLAGKVKESRRLQVSTETARDAWKETFDWGKDDEEAAEWLTTLFLSGSGMPGLVVDLWSPGALFLRHVEEFGDSGCMDAAYALGLWRTGSSFQVVNNAKIVPVDSPTSFQNDAYSGTEATSEGSSVFHVQGGACLRQEPVAKTASIYSTFLKQVADVYRHPRSGIAGQNPTRTYKDHWDHLLEGSDTNSEKPIPVGVSRNEDNTAASKGSKGHQRGMVESRNGILIREALSGHAGSNLGRRALRKKVVYNPRMREV